MGLLYTKMKVFRFPEKLVSLPRETPEVQAPLHVRLKPTNACNHRCRYCAYRADQLQLGQDMQVADSIPREKMKEIVEDLAEMGVKAVTFSGGGEPMVYPHLAETLRGLIAAGIRVASLTNGGRLRGEPAELLAAHGAWVRVSLDGWDGPSYARYRGVDQDEFSRVLDNMAAFKALGGPCLLGVSIIVDADNASHVYETVRRVKDAGADSVKVSPCILSNDGGENNAYHQPLFPLVKEQTARAKADLAGPGFEVFDAYHELELDFTKPYTWCPYSQILMVIGADQKVYPCQDKAYNLETGLLGSIREQRFRDFWFASKETFFRINPSVHCRHHCVANEKNKMVLEYLGADPGHLAFV
jgi:MoaA/NifB/PqqE/SkfB family radical SAM enzyme